MVDSLKFSKAETDNYISATNEATREVVENQIQMELIGGRYIKTDTKPTIVSALGANPMLKLG